MESQEQINILADTIGELLYALNEDLIQGPFYAGLRVSCCPNVSSINENIVAYIQHQTESFIEETKDENN